MSEQIDYIQQVQSSEIENDTDNEEKNNLVSDLQEANSILAYYKKEYGESDPDRYEKIAKEHEELRITTIESVKSENLITVNELDNIKKDFEDVENLEGYGDWINRKRLEAAKSLANSAFDFFKDGNYDHTKVLSQIESSNISNLNKNKVNAILGDAHHILVMSKNTKNYDEFKAQYIVIEGIISTALNSNNDLTLHDINGVQDAYSSLLTINELYNIEKNFEEKSGENYNKYTEKISKQRQERNEIRLRSIDISDKGNYSEEDAKNILYILNNNYSEYSEGFTEGTNEDSLLELNGKNREDIKSFQLRLLEKIIGNNGGFGNGYIVGYTDVSGYYLANEDTITQDISHKDYDISNETAINYLNYLYEKKGENIDLLKSDLISDFGEEKGLELIKILKEEKESIFGISSNICTDSFDSFNKSINVSAANLISDFNNSLKPEEIITLLDKLTYITFGESDDKIENLIEQLKIKGKTPLIMLEITNVISGLLLGGGSIHNTAQEKYLKEILGGTNGYGNDFLAGYNNEKGNYVTKIEDFKSYLSRNDTKMDGENEDENVVNSTMLGNYFKYLYDNGGLDQEKILNILGNDKIKELQNIWEKNESTQMIQLLKSYGIVDIRDKMSTINLTDSLDSINEVSDLINPNNLSNKILLTREGRTYISSITDKNKMLSLIEAYKEMPQKNESDSYDLNDSIKKSSLLYDIDIINEADIHFFYEFIQKINPEEIKNNKDFLIYFLTKYPDYTNDIVIKLEKNIYLDNSLRELLIGNIDNQNNLSGYGKKILLNIEPSIDNRESIIESLNNHLTASENELSNLRNTLDSYINNNGVSSIESDLVNYLNEGGEFSLVIKSNINSLKLASVLIEKEGIESYGMIPGQLYKQYSILFTKIVDKTNIDEIIDNIEYFPINNISEAIYLVKKIESLTNNKSKKESIYSNPNFTSMILDSIKGTETLYILDKDKPIIDKILGRVKDHSENIHKLVKVSDNIKDKVSGLDSSNQKTIIKNNLYNKLKDFKIPDEKIEDYFNILSNGSKVEFSLLTTTLMEDANYDKEKFDEIFDILTSEALYIKAEQIKKTILENPDTDLDEIEKQFNKSGLHVEKFIEQNNLNEIEKVYLKKINSVQELVILKNNKDLISAQGTINLDILEKLRLEGAENFDTNKFLEKYDIDSHIEEILFKEEVKRLEIEKLENNVEYIDNKAETSSEYQNYTLETNGDINFIINKETGEQIDLSSEEATAFSSNPEETIKNIIDVREKCDVLGLNFVFENRRELIQSMQNTPGFIDMEMNISDDFINVDEFNNLLKYVLYVSNGEYNDTLSANIASIYKLNQISATNNTTDTYSGLSIIGAKFAEAEFLTESGSLNTKWQNLHNYSPTEIA